MQLKEASSENKVNLTPMLDVVFIMLIFFVVTSTFVKEVGIDTSPPEPSVLPPPESKVKNILVAIQSNDQLVVDGRLSDQRTIQANLTRLHAERPKAAVVINAHPDSSAQSLVLVIDSARIVGAPVSLAGTP